MAYPLVASQLGYLVILVYKRRKWVLQKGLGLASIISDRQDLCCTYSSTRFWEIFENLKKCEIYKTYEQMGERGYWVGEHNGEGDC